MTYSTLGCNKLLLVNCYPSSGRTPDGVAVAGVRYPPLAGPAGHAGLGRWIREVLRVIEYEETWTVSCGERLAPPHFEGVRRPGGCAENGAAAGLREWLLVVEHRGVVENHQWIQLALKRSPTERSSWQRSVSEAFASLRSCYAGRGISRDSLLVHVTVREESSHSVASWLLRA